jgi:DNA (cytosine-5)-methyltransferase 1
MSTGQASAEIGIGTTLNCNHEAPIVTTQYGDVAGSLTARHDSSPCADRGQNVVAFQSKASASQSMNPSEISPTLDKGKGDGVAVAFTQNQAGDVLTGEVMHSLGTNQNATGRNAANVATGMQVRRLTPQECERLQGFPTSYTKISDKTADGPRYKALGNSMAVNVMRWIGERIEFVQSL